MPSTATHQFIICIEQAPNYRTGLTQTVFNVREEPSRKYVAASFRNLYEAQAWTERPVCTFEASHPGIPAPDDLPADEGWTETCDRPAEVRLFVRDREHDGDGLTYVCDGHAALISDDLAAEPLTTRPYCLRCEVPIYQGQDGVWRREATGVAFCPRNPARDGHEPPPVTKNMWIDEYEVLA